MALAFTETPLIDLPVISPAFEIDAVVAYVASRIVNCPDITLPALAFRPVQLTLPPVDIVAVVTDEAFCTVSNLDLTSPVVSIKFALAFMAPELILALVILPQLTGLPLFCIVVQNNPPPAVIVATSTLSEFLIINPLDCKFPVVSIKFALAFMDPELILPQLTGLPFVWIVVQNNPPVAVIVATSVLSEFLTINPLDCKFDVVSIKLALAFMAPELILPHVIVPPQLIDPELDIDLTSKTPKLFKVAFVVAPFFTIIP